MILALLITALITSIVEDTLMMLEIFTNLSWYLEQQYLRCEQ
jgi:hypothetical protein